MTLAEELVLCAIDANGMPAPKVVHGVGGAIAAELVLAGRIRLEDESVTLLDRQPTGDELLDPVIEGAADPNAASTRATWFVTNVGRVQWPKIRERVIASGLVTVQAGKKRKLWMDGPETLHPTPAGEEPRARLRALLLGQAQPDPRGAVLAGLAAACDLVKLHVPKDERKAAEQRAEATADATGIPEHVRDAIRGAQNATAAAMRVAQGSTS